MTQALTTRSLPGGTGVEVAGLDASRPLDDGTVAELQRLFVEAGVLVFRGVGTSSEAHVNVSRAFGELELHSTREAWLDGFAELIDISYRPPSDPLFRDLQPVYDVGGVHLAGWLAWHTDQCFVARLSRGGVLRAIQVPPSHGRTGFLDKIRLYDSLGDQLRRRIDGLRVVYRFEPRMDRNRFGTPDDVKLLRSSAGMDSIVERLERDFPPVSHPLVLTQRETGRRVLNFSPCYAVGIEGMPDEEADELLTALADHCTSADHAYVHDWQVDDLVAWDNWRMLHNAEGCLETETRLMHRTSIAGA